MPVKLDSKLPLENEARIEIIPLIDIMFFLLAAFMLVSLSMVNLKTVPVDLPTATQAISESHRDIVTLAVDRFGALYLEGQLLGAGELVLQLAARQQTNAALRLLISGDQEARHGDIIRALDLVRSTGLQKVAFEIRKAGNADGSPPNPR